MLLKAFKKLKFRKKHDFAKIAEYRKKQVLKQIEEYLMTKGPSFSSLFWVKNGEWNFSEESPVVSIVFPQIRLFIQVHSHLSKSYTSLELLGIPREQWENYQKQQAVLRNNAEAFNREITYIEFFWDDALDYCSVAEKLKKAGV